MKNDTEVSKFLSFLLRHEPEAIGLSLDPAGWADIATLLAQADKHERRIDRETLVRVVRTRDKKRFALSEDGTRIRAAQGHSLTTVNVQPQETTPPDVLYHGTAERFVDTIFAEGLQPRERQFVHLTADRETALESGKRYGKPVLLRVDARAMHAARHTFFLAENGVWLTKSVPPACLRVDGDATT